MVEACVSVTPTTHQNAPANWSEYLAGHVRSCDVHTTSMFHTGKRGEQDAVRQVEVVSGDQQGAVDCVALVCTRFPKKSFKGRKVRNVTLADVKTQCLVSCQFFNMLRLVILTLR